MRYIYCVLSFAIAIPAAGPTREAVCAKGVFPVSMCMSDVLPRFA